MDIAVTIDLNGKKITATRTLNVMDAVDPTEYVTWSSEIFEVHIGPETMWGTWNGNKLESPRYGASGSWDWHNASDTINGLENIVSIMRGLETY